MDRLILDFEKDTITIETDNQKGTEKYFGLNEKKKEIYHLLGYKETGISPFVEAIEGLFNGELTADEVARKLDSWLEE